MPKQFLSEMWWFEAKTVFCQENIWSEMSFDAKTVFVHLKQADRATQPDGSGNAVDTWVGRCEALRGGKSSQDPAFN